MARITGTVGKNGYEFYADLVEMKLDDYIATNTTIVKYDVYIKNNGTRFNSNNWTKYIKVDSETIYEKTGENINTTTVGFSEALVIMSGTISVKHDDDGTKKIKFEAGLKKSTSYSSYDPGECTLSGELELTNIPRKSSVSASGSGYIGETLTIYVDSADKTNLRHTLKYTFGSLENKTIASNVVEKYQWTLPNDLYAQIPDDPEGKGVITCETYAGATLVGTTTCEFTARVSETSSKPTTVIEVTDTNDTCYALTGSRKKLIKYYSNVKVTLTANARNSAKITDIAVYRDDVKGDASTPNTTTASINHTFNKVETSSFKGVCTDSRGFTATNKAAGITIVDYVKLTVNPEIFRPEETGSEIKMTITGNYFNGSFGNKNNSLTLKYRYKEKSATTWSDYITLTPTISGNGYSITTSVGTNFDYQKSYDFEVMATDSLATIAQTSNIKAGIPVMGLFETFVEMFGHKIIEKEDNSVSITANDVKSKNLVKSYYNPNATAQYAVSLYADFDIKPNTTYTISFKSNTAGDNFYTNELLFNSVRFIGEAGGLIKVTCTSLGASELASATKSVNGYAILKNRYALTTSPTFTEVQIEPGSAFTGYVEHKEFDNGAYKKPLTNPAWLPNNTTNAFQMMILNLSDNAELYVNGTLYNVTNTRIQGFSVQSDTGRVCFQFGCITYSSVGTLIGKVVYRYKHGSSGSGGNWTTLN